MTDHQPAIQNSANLIWGIAELLRGDYKQSDYGKVILPLVVMRRLDQVLEPTKAKVLAEAEQLEREGIGNAELLLRGVAGQQFFNRSKLAFAQLLDDPSNIAAHLRGYIDGFSALARQALDKFEFEQQIDRLDRSNLLYQVIARVCEVDLSPGAVSNLEMGYLFEELIRRFAEQSNETAGEHFTPREVVQLMVNLLLDGDEEALTETGAIRTVFDCACGTGGMLSEAFDHIHALNPNAAVHLYGQELNPESYAICLADMLVKGVDASHIVFGNSLSQDGHTGPDARFHYGIANPPFGVDWKKVEQEVKAEHAQLGDDGRFGPGLPRISDGQLLFQLHLLSKMREPEQGGGRVAIVHNGSPLFTGGAGSGESEIRRHVLENDLLEAIVALPEQLFYNTGIATYVWLLSNRKPPERAGIVQLIDAREKWKKMGKTLGEKRRFIPEEDIAEITRLHGAFEESEHVKLVPVEDFGYRTITVEQPLRARWAIGPRTWDGVEDEKALARLGEEERAALVAALRDLRQQEYADEADAKQQMMHVAKVTGPKPATALVRALFARTLVRDPEAPVVRDAKGNRVPDPELRDTENVPLSETVQAYLEREVHPWVPDAWAPDPEGKIGYEIPFTRLFYMYEPPRPSAEIKEELRELEGEIRRLLEGVIR
jgi:type I restriction enzyme M protein